MSYHHISNRVKCKLTVSKRRIIFCSVYQISYKLQIIVTLDERGKLFLNHLQNGQSFKQVQLQNKGNNIETLLTVSECEGFMCVQSTKSIYILNLIQIFEQNKEGEVLILNKQISKLLLTEKQKNITNQYQTLMNKQVFLIKSQQQLFIKLIGRIHKNIKYFYGILNMNHNETKITLTFENQFSYQTKISLFDLTANFIVYDSYCPKSKPITLFYVQFFPSQNKESSISLIKEVTIIHFIPQITILQTFSLNNEIVCIFGNNNLQNVSSTLMIIYNIKEKYTLNYLYFQQVLIQKVIFFPKPYDHFDYKESTVKFDGFQIVNGKSKCFQLYPQTYVTNADCLLDGQAIFSTKKYIITKLSDELLIYPKINKKSIYYKWLHDMKIKQPSFLQTVTNYLE